MGQLLCGRGREGSGGGGLGRGMSSGSIVFQEGV